MEISIIIIYLYACYEIEILPVHQKTEDYLLQAGKANLKIPAKKKTHTCTKIPEIIHIHL